MIPENLTLCPRCRTPMNAAAATVRCLPCGQDYPRLGTIPILLRDPERYLQSCRRELGAVVRQAADTIQALETQLQMKDLLPSTRSRCEAAIGAIRSQTNDITGILNPVLGEPDCSAKPSEPAALLRYIQCLYRDWGWPEDPKGESESALSIIESVAGTRPLGRTLVLGAGGCRLAYDLHQRFDNPETVVLDIDPLLFTIAQGVIRGGSLVLHEANAEIDEIARISQEWNLEATFEPAGDDRFHFFIADGREPPFADATFDSVVTPWFIDVVPNDLRDLMSEIYRLLKRDGRWINFGPLHYRPETPAIRRFSRDEIFELAELAGFQMGRFTAGSIPYLVSKLNGRGKVERVQAFTATKDASESLERKSGPPAWLLFGHLPVPTFPGLATLASNDPANRIVAAAIDGIRTLNDIVAVLSQAGQGTGLSKDQFREIVRRSLCEIHPDCAST